MISNKDDESRLSDSENIEQIESDEEPEKTPLPGVSYEYRYFNFN